MKQVAILRSSTIFEDSRMTKLAEALTSLGFEVVCLCWDRAGTHTKEETFTLPNKKTVQVKMFNKKCSFGGGFKNLPKMLSFHNFLKREVKKLPQGTIIHACDYDTAKPIYKLCKNKFKLFYDIFDFYSDTHAHLPRIIANKIKKEEINIINNADASIVCTEQRVEQIKGSTPQKLVIIHNTPNLPTREATSPNKKLKVCYIGQLGENRLLKEILQEIPSHPEFEFVFGGLGSIAQDVENMCKTIPNATYLGKMNYSEVLKEEQKCDVLFATYNPAIKNHNYSAPNKFYEAGCLSKPIIVCNNMGIDQLVKKYNTGICIEYTAQDFFHALDKLNKDRSLYATLAQNANNAYETQFKWSIMFDRIEDLYTK